MRVQAGLSAVLAALLLLLLGGCARKGGGGGGRAAVTGLAFPTGLPEPAPLETTMAFPRLTFERPLFLTHAPDGTDRIFVVEKDGRIHVFPNRPDADRTRVFLDLSSRVATAGEQGLLGLAFHPAYSASFFFYVYYSIDAPARSRVSRFRVSADPEVADLASETILLEFAQPFSNHKGGMLAFGPDGMLYIASGDGGSGGDPFNNAQTLTNLLGKVLRLDPDGGIPPDNPLVGLGGGVREEIWAWGLRNPWRFSFDRGTGRLWLGDVGQDAYEEIDIIEKGGNYGWRLFEGEEPYNNPDRLPASDFEGPVLAYGRGEGRSVTGGYVYRGTAMPSLAGAYLYGDFVSGRIWALVHDGTQLISNAEVASVPNPASFGEDQAGEVHVCSFEGRIYRLESSAAPKPFPQTLSATGLFSDTAGLVAAAGLHEYEVNSPLWSDGARKRRWLALPGVARIIAHPTGAWQFPVGTVLTEHFELEVAPGTMRRVETRVLVHHQAGWQGFTYRWNDAQTDADLLDGVRIATFTILDPEAPGGQREQIWPFPGRDDCLSCHTAPAGPVLGVRPGQLNRGFPDAAGENQLAAWSRLGLLDRDLGDPGTHPALPDPLDEDRPLAERARSYLDANCAQCHLPGGPTPVDLDLRYEVPVDAMNAVGVPPAGDSSQVPGSLRITAGSKERSVVWELMGRLGTGRMPPLASNRVDKEALELIGAWIDVGAP